MLKYVESAITFCEFPDEIALCLNLSLCPNHCLGCSESYLAEDIGEELTYELLDDLIIKNPGITLIGFMGGDNDHNSIEHMAKYIHEKWKLKAGMYSGQDSLDFSLAEVLDYYKIGGWRPFTGDENTWQNQTAGPLCLPTSNQIMFKRVENKLINITDKFRKYPVNNWKSVIL